MVRLALIGAGSHCRGNHAPALAEYAANNPDRLALAAVCDLNRERAESAAEQFGFPAVYTDHEDMIEKEQPDGCVCVMPISNIAPMAIDLLQRGMSATVEKPLGATLDEVEGLVAVARETGTPNMVSVNRRFEPLTCRGLAWAQDRGPIRYVRATILRHNRKERGFVSGTAIHCIDALRHIGGEVARHGVAVHNGDPPWFHITFEFQSGALGSLDVLPTDGSVEERYEIFGEGYRVDARVGPSPSPRLRCWQDGKIEVDERPARDEPEYIRVGPYAETHEFVTALDQGRPPWPSVEEIFPSVEIAYRIDPTLQSSD